MTSKSLSSNSHSTLELESHPGCITSSHLSSHHPSWSLHSFFWRIISSNLTTLVVACNVINILDYEENCRDNVQDLLVFSCQKIKFNFWPLQSLGVGWVVGGIDSPLRLKSQIHQLTAGPSIKHSTDLQLQRCQVLMNPSTYDHKDRSSVAVSSDYDQTSPS